MLIKIIRMRKNFRTQAAFISDSKMLCTQVISEIIRPGKRFVAFGTIFSVSIHFH